MSKCNKLNCPMQYNKVADDCDIKDCPYRTTDKIEDWETASKFLAMIFETFEKQRKENTEKSNEIVAFPEKPKKEQIEEMAKEMCEVCYSKPFCKVISTRCPIAIRDAERLYNAGYRKQKHGTWYHGTENGAVYAKCSACGRKMDYSCYGYAYCALCGARMDGARIFDIKKGGE